MCFPPELRIDCLLTRKQLHAEGFKTAKFVHIDVTDTTTIQAAKEIIENAEGKLDVLVNNAGRLMFLLASNNLVII